MGTLRGVIAYYIHNIHIRRSSIKGIFCWSWRTKRCLFLLSISCYFLFKPRMANLWPLDYLLRLRLHFLKGQFQSIKSQSFHIDISMYRQMSFPSFLGERMDIPAEYISVAKYRATLGHKLNHSFRANCEEWFLDHPRFGIIPCERTNVGSI